MVSLVGCGLCEYIALLKIFRNHVLRGLGVNSWTEQRRMAPVNLSGLGMLKPRPLKTGAFLSAHHCQVIARTITP